MAIPIPSTTELQSFYEAHFGAAATSRFSSDFLSYGVGDEARDGYDGYDGYFYDDEVDDGLGYYPDGVKRTLTDEQIAMFRHSEMEALRRHRARAGQQTQDQPEPAGSDSTDNADNNDNTDNTDNADNADNTDNSGNTDNNGNNTDNKRPRERVGDTPPSEADEECHRNKKQKTSSRGQNRNKQPAWREPKPDLRKRTWDVVDKGLDSLDYDDT